MSESRIRMTVNDAIQKGRDLTRLTTLPGFDFSECEAPHGRDLAALKQIIVLDMHESIDMVSQKDVALGIRMLFQQACVTRSKFAGFGDRIWEVIWKTGPWYGDSERSIFPDVSENAIKAAIDFYVAGYRKRRQTTNTIRLIGHPASDLCCHVVNAFDSVAEWLQSEDITPYHVTYMGAEDDMANEEGVGATPRKRQRMTKKRLDGRPKDGQVWEGSVMEQDNDASEESAILVERHAAIAERDATITELEHDNHLLMIQLEEAESNYNKVINEMQKIKSEHVNAVFACREALKILYGGSGLPIEPTITRIERLLADSDSNPNI
ncbi:hypothetical protein F5Y06DRAFT_301577 [Hypoxylon sp. FL0890]|nr:hypothetical protein F5Y06DRAFT_301577 [Hypoxylon sp. FL0890]